LTKRQFDILLEETGAVSTNGLRKIDAHELQNIAKKYKWNNEWGPLIDGDLVPDSPINLMKDGRFALADILITTVLDEGTIYIAKENIASEQDFYDFLHRYYSENEADQITKLYMSNSIQSVFQAASVAYRDIMFACPALELLSAAQEHVKAYCVVFDVVPRLPSFTGSLSHSYGAFHGSDIMLLFQSLPLLTIGQNDEASRIQQLVLDFMGGSDLPNHRSFLEDDLIRCSRLAAFVPESN
jgi:carboxylesterase type B